MTDINLDHLLSEEARFGHSGREPTSMDQMIRGPRPYYYSWSEHGQFDVAIFTDPTNVTTLKIFRYGAEIYRGVNLERDAPTFVGQQAVGILQAYARRVEKMCRDFPKISV